jgi:5-methylcytosine-specific restriction endonuclease McrA
MKLIEEMKAQMDPSATYAEVFERAIKKALGIKPPQRSVTSAPEVKTSKKRPYISIHIRRKLEPQCSYVSPLTSKRCKETRRLQIEHIHPFALGGSSTKENLTYLCATHNRLRAIEVYGEKKMRPYLRV